MYDVQVSGVLYKIYLQAELLWSTGISRQHACRPVFRYNISINKMQVPNMNVSAGYRRTSYISEILTSQRACCLQRTRVT